MLHVDDLQRRIEDTARTAGPEPTFPQLELQRLLPHLRLQHTVEPRPALVGYTRYERLWVQINRVVRRFAAHAVEPAVVQQNEFNSALLAALEQFADANAALRAAINIERMTEERRTKN
jgi:hypothetical protein